MRVLEADLDHIRLTVRRPARVSATLLLLAVLVLVLGPLVWWSLVVGHLMTLREAAERPPPKPLDCTWPNLGSASHCANVTPELRDLPSLSQVYLSRRTYHRAHLFPTAFTPPPPVIAPLKPPFANLVTNDYERRLIAQVLRDAGVPLDDEPVDGHAASWLGRDPVLGVPLGGRQLDDETTMQRVLDYQPDLPVFADYRTTSLEQLIDQGLLRLGDTSEAEEIPTRWVADPVAMAHLSDRAANDVRYFAALRDQAVAGAVAQQHAGAMARWKARREDLHAEIAVWRAHRRAGVPGVIGAWGIAALLVFPLTWQRKRRFEIGMDLHALTLGDTRILWESLEELIWTPRKVTFRLESGAEGEISQLALSNSDIRMLERTSDAMWLQDRNAPSDATQRAIRQLVEGARRRP
ncbi:MAG: hypothetical protein AAGA48_13390 [Myxococcota bacterium]